MNMGWIKHIKRWNEWRKHNGNSSLHKLLVLLGIVKSPTFSHTFTKEECEEIEKAFEKGFKEGLNNGK